MRILAATPWVPSTRRPRSYGLLQMLAASHDLHLVAACWSEEDEADLAALPFSTEGVSLRRPGAVTRAGAGLLTDRPLQQAYLSSPRMRRALDAATARLEPEALYLNTLRSAQWRSGARAPRLLIDLDEFRSGYYRQAAAAAQDPVRRRVFALEAARMEAEEARILGDCDLVLVSSPLDLRPDEPHVRLVRSPDALRAEDLPQREGPGEGVVFVGRMSYGANVDAVTWLADEVWPDVADRHASARWRIVGDAPVPSVRALASDTVDVVGRVPDVGPFYRDARLSVVPVTSATGVQMKLIESLRSGVPTVTTPLVARQAGVRHQREVLVASTRREWIDAISLLLTDDDLAIELGRRGRAWADRTYARPSIEATLFDALADVPGVGAAGQASRFAAS